MNKELKKILDESKYVVFFGGAGVSTESGLPDFRSENGLYNANQKYGHSPEEMLSHTFFTKNTEDFFDYYKNNLIHKDIKPNKAHHALARMEELGKLKAIVTQNIDGLHQLAGSKIVYELHGSILRNYCMKCNTYYDLDYIMNPMNCKSKIPAFKECIGDLYEHSIEDINKHGLTPVCKRCGGIVKPDVVLYEEGLNQEVINGAVEAIASADTLIVGGTSLVVYPAAGLINYFCGRKLVLINKSKTQYDNQANLVIHEAIGEVLE